MPKNKPPRWKIADWTQLFNAAKPEAEQVAESTVSRWCKDGLLDAEKIETGPFGVWAISTPPDQFSPPKAGRPVVII